MNNSTGFGATRSNFHSLPHAPISRPFSSEINTQQSVVTTNRHVCDLCHPNTTTYSKQHNVSSSSSSGLQGKEPGIGSNEEIHKSSDRNIFGTPDVLQISFHSPNEVTLRNVKCISEKSGIQSVDGTKVNQYKEMLINNVLSIKAAFISYDSVIGEWKFRVHHF